MNNEHGIMNIEDGQNGVMENKRKYDLQERLIEFAVLILAISENLYNSKAGNHMAGQMIRSGTSPALHYGEAQSAESRADFIHKIKIILKELRETINSLLIIRKVPLTGQAEKIEKALVECNELISIFMKSVETAKKNMEADKHKPKS